jgi:hypothetical protein
MCSTRQNTIAPIVLPQASACLWVERVRTSAIPPSRKSASATSGVIADNIGLRKVAKLASTTDIRREAVIHGSAYGSLLRVEGAFPKQLWSGRTGRSTTLKAKK